MTQIILFLLLFGWFFLIFILVYKYYIKLQSQKKNTIHIFNSTASIPKTIEIELNIPCNIHTTEKKISNVLPNTPTATAIKINDDTLSNSTIATKMNDDSTYLDTAKEIIPVLAQRIA